jgi:hypothetical protein
MKNTMQRYTYFAEIVHFTLKNEEYTTIINLFGLYFIHFNICLDLKNGSASSSLKRIGAEIFQFTTKQRVRRIESIQAHATTLPACLKEERIKLFGALHDECSPIERQWGGGDSERFCLFVLDSFCEANVSYKRLKQIRLEERSFAIVAAPFCKHPRPLQTRLCVQCRHYSTQRGEA